jgi:S1-C subfamily serine protease
VQVGGVVPGSPAEQAGIQPGDVITAVGGRTVTSTADLHAAVSPHRPGDTVTVAWTDATGQQHTASIRLGTGPVG